MSVNTALQRKLVAIILSIALVCLGVFSFLSIQRLQGNARVINYAGVVRGATQRLVKEELYGQPDDTLVSRLDNIIEELLTGEGDLGLIRLNDEQFQNLMAQMKEDWAVLKLEIGKVRQGADEKRLFDLSQDYFELADQTVAEAEAYSEKNAGVAEKCFIVLAGIFALVAGFLIWLSSIQRKRQKALQEAETKNKVRREHLSQLEEELQVPINEISELVYVADVETYDLLFMNEAGKKIFNVEDISNKKCYTLLQGFQTPCPFCTNEKLVPGENYNWEITNPVTHRHYMLKDRLIEWNGRKARMEIAFDLTQVEVEKEKLQYALDIETMMMECIRTLYQGHDLEKDINRVLDQLGSFLQAERVYLFSIRDRKFFNDFEWCVSGIPSQKETLQEIPLSIFERWMDIFMNQECVVIEDLEQLRDGMSPEYKTLSHLGVKSLVVVPMESAGELVGCLGVANPPAEKLWNIGSPLQTLVYFMLLAFKRFENEQQLSHLSFHDTLTSFYNRNRFVQDLETVSDAVGSVGIVYLDVNGLKEINDKYGHARGDQILIRAAGKIRSVFQQADCYRVGGDEFVVICTDIPGRTFEEHVIRLKKSFENDTECNAAIGTQWAKTGDNINQIIAEADARMYEDKKKYYRKSKYVNRYRHHSDELLQLANPQVLQEEIDRHQFEVYLQPKISSSDRSTVGAEALIRYRSSDGSLILPGNFLPILEEAKSISQIDFYVFDFVCSKIKSWSKDGKKGIPISVNFSQYSLVQPSFVERLKEICEKYEISPTYLEIEMTENAEDVEDNLVRDLISRLRREGFGIAIDDFGIDYSNFAMLSAVEFDILKLDRSLIKDIADNPRTQAIVQSIVETCKKMDIKVVAAGIEKEEQLLMLRAFGVELVQGYLFGKPIPAADYEAQYIK